MTATTKLTLEQFLAQPERKPYREYVDGEVTEKPMPTGAHAIIQRLLSFIFTVYLREQPGGDAGSEIRCVFRTAGTRRSYVPDFVYVGPERMRARRGPQHGPPDLAVEILSRDDRPSRITAKVTYYLQHGVRLVWLIDPRARTVLVLRPDAADALLHEDAVLDGGDVIPGFRVPVRELLTDAGTQAEDAP